MRWLNPASLYILTGIASILLTFLAIVGHPSLNPDSAFYLYSAHMYLQKGLHAALSIYNWPFYSLMIAWVSKLTGLSLLNAAYLHNAVFSILTVFVFIRLIKLMGGDFPTQCVAALIFLLWQEFNGFRADIIRGHGYWFFCLLGLYFAVAFVKYKKWWCWVLALVAFVFSTLYRLEGGTLVALIPMTVFFAADGDFKARVFCLLKVVFISFFLLFLLIILALFIFHIPLFFHVTQELFFSPIKKPSFYLFHFLSFWLIFFSVLDWGYVILLGYGVWRSSYRCLKVYLPVLITYVFIIGIIGFIFFLHKNFISDRYLMAPLLGLMPLLPFALRQLYLDWRQKKWQKKYISAWLFPAVFLLMLSMLIASIYPFGPSHRYIYQASRWLHKNVPTSSFVYTNVSRVAILSDRLSQKQSMGWFATLPYYFEWKQLSHPDIIKANFAHFQGAYPVFHVKDDRQVRIHELESIFGKPLKVFKNRRNQQVLIFKPFYPDKKKGGSS